MPAWSGATVSFRLHPARRRFQPSPSPAVVSSQLVIRRTWLPTVGDRALPVVESCLWNSLPPDLTSAPTLFFVGTVSKLISFPDHFLPTCFRFLGLYTVFSTLLLKPL